MEGGGPHSVRVCSLQRALSGLSLKGLGWPERVILGVGRAEGMETHSKVCVQLDAPPGWSGEPGGLGAGSMPQFPQLSDRRQNLGEGKRMGRGVGKVAGMEGEGLSSCQAN